MDNAKISSIQLAFLGVSSALMFPYTFMPILKEPPANQDAWIVLILAIAYIIILSLPILFLTNKFRGLDIVDVNMVVFGKLGGRIAASIYMLFALFCYVACLLLMTIFIKTYLMSETPMWAILIFLIVPSIYAIFKGPGLIARLATFIVPLILATIIFFFLLGIKDMDVSELSPILGDSTFWDINKGAFITAARVSESLIIFVFSYYLMKQYSINKSYFIFISIFFIAFMIMVIGTLLLVGSDVAKLTHSPFFFFSRQVGGEEIVQRVQSFNVISWLCGTLIKLAIYGNIFIYILLRIIGKKKKKPYIWGLLVFSFLIASIPFVGKMTVLNILRGDYLLPWIVVFVIFLFSLLIIIIYLLRRKKIKERIEIKLKEKAAKEKWCNNKKTIVI